MQRDLNLQINHKAKKRNINIKFTTQDLERAKFHKHLKSIRLAHINPYKLLINLNINQYTLIFQSFDKKKTTVNVQSLKILKRLVRAEHDTQNKSNGEV